MIKHRLKLLIPLLALSMNQVHAAAKTISTETSNDNVKVITTSQFDNAKQSLERRVDFSIPNEGLYYVSILIRGEIGATYTVAFDNSTTSTKIQLHKAGWQSITLNNSNPINLDEGVHAYTFTGNRIANITNIRYSTTQSESVFDTDHIDATIRSLSSNDIQSNQVENKALLESLEYSASAAPDPLYDFEYWKNQQLRYTYQTTIYLTKGTTVTYETKGTSRCNPVMFIFKNDDPGTQSWSNDDGGSGNNAKLTITAPVSGTYKLLVKSTNAWTRGTADLYKNNVKYASNIQISGTNFHFSKSLGSVIRNYIVTRTQPTSSANPVLFVHKGGSTAAIKYRNDNYVNTFGGDAVWGNQSRVRTTYNATDITVAAQSPYGDYLYVDVMGGLLESKPGETSPWTYSQFPKLKQEDVIRTSASTKTYKCIAWAGGVTNYHVWPLNAASPWYSSDPYRAFDNYFGNTSSAGYYAPRYSGSPMYVRWYANESNADIAIWMKGSEHKHGAIRQGGDHNMHGYAWESKIGSGMRFFHPLNSLDGTSYGSVNHFYREFNPYGAQKSETIRTSAESIEKGLSVMQKVPLAVNDNNTNAKLIENIPVLLQMKFISKMNKWKKTWKNLEVESDPRSYTKSKAYRRLKRFCKRRIKVIWPLLIDMYQQEGYESQVLLTDVLYPNNEELMAEAKEQNLLNATKRQATLMETSNNEVYVIPNSQANWNAFLNLYMSKNQNIQ